MKRLLLALSIFSPALLGMDPPPKAKKPKKVVTEEQTFDIFNYVNKYQLMVSMGAIFFAEEEEKKSSSDESSEDSSAISPEKEKAKKIKAKQKETEEKQKQNETLRKVTAALIQSFKFDQCILSLEDATKKEATVAEKGKKADAKIVKLSAVCDISKLTAFLTKITTHYFDNQQSFIDYEQAKFENDLLPELQREELEPDEYTFLPDTCAQDFIKCIKITGVKKEFGDKSSQYTTLLGLTRAKDPKLSHCIAAVVKAFFGLDLEQYVDVVRLNELAATYLSIKNGSSEAAPEESVSIADFVGCVNPQGVLMLMGCKEKDAKTAGAVLKALLTLAYELAIDEHAAINKMFEVLELYANYNSRIKGGIVALIAKATGAEAKKDQASSESGSKKTAEESNNPQDQNTLPATTLRKTTSNQNNQQQNVPSVNPRTASTSMQNTPPVNPRGASSQMQEKK